MIQPDMRVLVDLGYNWTGDADVSTPATLSNPDIDFTAVNDYLNAGADQGMLAALVDMGLLPQSDLADIADLYPYVPDVGNLMAGALNDHNAGGIGCVAVSDRVDGRSVRIDEPTRGGVRLPIPDHGGESRRLLPASRQLL